MTASHLGGHCNYTHLDEGALRYLKNEFGLKSMVDVGCGPGGMEAIAKKLDIEWTGIDGDPTISKPSTILHDFRKPFVCQRYFDLGWSTEFLEHVEEEYIPNYMPVFQHCRVVFVTAAPVGETRGHHHVNLQNQPYWVKTFTAYGFTFDAERTAALKRASTMIRNFVERSGMVFVNT